MLLIPNTMRYRLHETPVIPQFQMRPLGKMSALHVQLSVFCIVFLPFEWFLLKYVGHHTSLQLSTDG